MVPENYKSNLMKKVSLEKIDEILKQYELKSSSLLKIILHIQDVVEENYFPPEASYYLAEKLNIKPTQVFDVITFFSAIHTRPRSKYPIEVCSSIACKVNNNYALLENLKTTLGIDIGEATSDRKFSLEKVQCFGACDVAPAIRIKGKVYGKLTSKDKILEVLNSFE